MKKILIIIVTHGNEKIGLEVVKNLEDIGLKKYFDVLIANPEALKKNRRYLEYDLNRSYPGKKNSKFYEKRLAFENLKIAKKYNYIIDIHEASEGMENFIIVPKKKFPKKFPLELLGLKKVLLWPEPKGPISQILENAIELEFGMKGKNRDKVINKCTKITTDFILALEENKKNKETKKEVYYVYEKLLLGKQNKESFLKDFQKIDVDNETFFPLLTNQYLREGIKCYKMKKIM